MCNGILLYNFKLPKCIPEIVLNICDAAMCENPVNAAYNSKNIWSRINHINQGFINENRMPLPYVLLWASAQKTIQTTVLQTILK